MYDLHKDKKRTENKRFFIIVCIAYPLILATLTESCQTLFFFPRVAEWFDWLSNITGFFAGWAIFMIFKRKSQT